mgnify:CR=1 FL=1
MGAVCACAKGGKDLTNELDDFRQTRPSSTSKKAVHSDVNIAEFMSLCLYLVNKVG